jgi:tetraacyldisaccharide 4'-kinase
LLNAIDFVIVKLLRYILFPIVPIYYLVTWLRNTLYDLGIKSSTSYDFPVICVGNLSVGGTGKTPMIEYLIRLLKSEQTLATLSRGYKRKTKGFVIADGKSDAFSLGDEPYQFYRKFSNIIVGVDENRRHGISELMLLNDKPEVILLDDAFQHRKVKAGFNILLTAYDNLYANDMVLPTGNLREPKSGAQRADVIVVTKCPENVLEIDKQNISKALKPRKNQSVFFSTIKYSSSVKGIESEMTLDALKGEKITLITGIANSKPLVQYLKESGLDFEHLNFKDHHEFTNDDIEILKKKDFILTTEKDFVRLEPYFKMAKNIYYLPIEMDIDNAMNFNNVVLKFINKF